MQYELSNLCITAFEIGAATHVYAESTAGGQCVISVLYGMIVSKLSNSEKLIKLREQLQKLKDFHNKK